MDRVRGDSDPVSLSGRRALVSVSLATLVFILSDNHGINLPSLKKNLPIQIVVADNAVHYWLPYLSI